MAARNKPIGKSLLEVAQISPNAMQGEFSYIDLSSVDKDEKRISIDQVSRVSWDGAPSRARHIVKAGDVLVSTVRPNLNGVAVVPCELDGAIASSGFSVLRSNSQCLDSRYLFHWVRSPQFIDDMTRRATGASYPAVSDRIVQESLMPLPGLAEQHRIGCMLEIADGIRRKRREALKLADKFLQLAFIDLFGDLFKESTDKWIALGTSTDFIDYRGKTPEKSASGVRLITAKNVRVGEITLEPAEFISEQTYSVWMTRGYPTAGDVLFTTEAPLGNVAILSSEGPVAIGQRLIAIRPRALLCGQYLCWALRHEIIQRDIFARSTGSTVKGIRSAELERVKIPIPSTYMQAKFREMVARVDRLKLRAAAMHVQSDELFQSLQHRAFSSQLTIA